MNVPTRQPSKDSASQHAPQERAAMPAVANGEDSTGWKSFESELKVRERELAALLPPSLDFKRFQSALIIAVKKDPDLLTCERRYLHNAAADAATDGLLPDRREGVILWQIETLDRGTQKERKVKTARWQPMLLGIRKRARELDQLIIGAEVVYKNDFFEREAGDNPSLTHKPVGLDVPQGPRIGVYAIFKREDGTILHREVMRSEEVETIRQCSKQPDGLMWKKFTGEAWKKCPVRRGSKSVPCSEKLTAIINRFDDIVDIEGASERLRPKREVIDMAAVPSAAAAQKPATKQIKAPREEPVLIPEGDAIREFLVDLDASLSACKTDDDLHEVWAERMEAICSLETKDRSRADDSFERHQARVEQASQPVEAEAIPAASYIKNGAGKQLDMLGVPSARA